MKTSPKGLDLIKKWEGCRLKAYQDSVGVWTIGYGLTSAAGIAQVYPGMVITQEKADEYLVRALKQYEQAVERALTRTPTQSQFDAMVSLCYNIGPGAFAKSSVVRRFNDGDIPGSADAFLMWNKAGGRELQGLTNRRKDERKLFLTPSEAVETVPPPPAPTPPPAAETPPAATPAPSGGFWAAVLAIITAIFGGRK